MTNTNTIPMPVSEKSFQEMTATDWEARRHWWSHLTPGQKAIELEQSRKASDAQLRQILAEYRGESAGSEYRTLASHDARRTTVTIDIQDDPPPTPAAPATPVRDREEEDVDDNAKENSEHVEDDPAK